MFQNAIDAPRVALFVFLGCAPNASGPSPAASPAAVSDSTVSKVCSAWATLQDGSKLYSNNVFNEAKAEGPYEQCLLERQRGGRRDLGWSWSWPGFEPSSFGYPEILFGKKPWEPATTDARLPRRISELSKLAVHYEVATEGTGSHPLTLSAWITSSGQSNGQTWSSIVGEVAVWLDFEDGATPEGQSAGALELEGVSYELFLDENHGDRGDGKGWAYYTARGPRAGAKGTVALDALLRAMVAKGYWDAALFVSSVEFGNEVRSGTGTTWIESYEVEL